MPNLPPQTIHRINEELSHPDVVVVLAVMAFALLAAVFGI